MIFSLVPAILVIATVQSARLPRPKKELNEYLDAVKDILSDRITNRECNADPLVYAWLRYHEYRLIQGSQVPYGDSRVSANIKLLKKKRKEFETNHSIKLLSRHKKSIRQALMKFHEQINDFITKQTEQYKDRPANPLYESSVRNPTLTWFRRCQRHEVFQDNVKCSGFCCLPSNTSSLQLSCDQCGLLNDLGKTWNDIIFGEDATKALNSILNDVEITVPKSNEDEKEHKPNGKLPTIEEFGGLPDGYDDDETGIDDGIVIPQRKKVAGQKTEEVKHDPASETCQRQSLCKTVSKWCPGDKLVSSTEEGAKGLGAVRIDAQITEGSFSGRFKEMFQAIAAEGKKQEDALKQMDDNVAVDDVEYESQPKSSLESDS